MDTINKGHLEKTDERGNRRYMLVLKYYDECILAAIYYYSTYVYGFIVSEHSYRIQRIRVNNRCLKIKNTFIYLLSMIISVSPVLVFVRFAIRFKAYLVKINKQKKNLILATEIFYFFGTI